MEHHADPLRIAVDNWVGYLPHPISSCERPQQATHFNLLHMPLRASVAEFTSYGKVVEVAGTLEFLGDLP
jgi:hypothetical protein